MYIHMESVTDLRIRLIRDRLTTVEALVADAMPVIAQLKADNRGPLTAYLRAAQRTVEKAATRFRPPPVPFTDLRRLVLAAADLREQSWRPLLPAIVELPAVVAFPPSKGEYRLSESEAADLACQLLRIDPMFAVPVGLLLLYAWNDILDWAGDHGGREPEVTIPEGFVFPSRDPVNQPPAA